MGGEGGELFADQIGLFGVNPTDQGVVGGVPVGVLDRELGFPDATEAV